MKKSSTTVMSKHSSIFNHAKSLPPNAGKGRKAGVPNRIGSEVKNMILGALETAGGEAYLVEQARLNPVAFMTLLSKVIPRDHSLTKSGTYSVNVITGVNR